MGHQGNPNISNCYINEASQKRREAIRLGSLCGFLTKGDNLQKREETKKVGFGFLGLKDCGEMIQKCVRKLVEDEGCFKFLKLNFLQLA